MTNEVDPLQRMLASLEGAEESMRRNEPAGLAHTSVTQAEFVERLGGAVGVNLRKRPGIPYFHADKDHPEILVRELNGEITRGAMVGNVFVASAEKPSSPPPRRRVSWLTVSEQFNLEHACGMLVLAGFSVYHVGSSLHRADYRDVDVRAILDDEMFDQMFGNNALCLGLFNTALSEWLSARSSLPVDFQFQRRTNANETYPGERNAVGISQKGAA